MKVLVVCSGNSGKVSPFISEQIETLASLYPIEYHFFLIKEKGLRGYLRHLPKLKKTIKLFQPDIIHAHYGFSGLLSNLQRKIPVVTTYTGSDVNDTRPRTLTIFSILLSKFNIFVSCKMKHKVYFFAKKNTLVIPYGILIDTFFPVDKNIARQELSYKNDDKLVLFSSKFSRQDKNAPLALASIKLLDGVKLIELTGKHTKDEMNYIFNAVDVSLMTSIAEGSPQFIKEAMACNCPIVSVDVGDVKEVIENTDGCFLCNSYKKEEIADKIQQALQYGKRTNGRERILNLGYDTNSISKKLMSIYNQILAQK